LIDIPKEDVPKWIMRLKNNSKADVLREIALTYEVQKHDLAMMLSNLFDGTTGLEVEAIWHWDIKQSGRGIDDERLNEALCKLIVKKV
jgi:hypothetical protein